MVYSMAWRAWHGILYGLTGMAWYMAFFSNLLITRTCIILSMSSNFGQIGPPTTELAALERLRNTPIDL